MLRMLQLQLLPLSPGSPLNSGGGRRCAGAACAASRCWSAVVAAAGAAHQQQKQQQQQQQQQQQPSRSEHLSAAPPPLLQPQDAGTFTVSSRELLGKGKVRLDAYLSTQLPAASRAKIAASIKAGLVAINGSAAAKPSLPVRGGDVIRVALLPPEPCMALPEAIPLDVVYEDADVLVVNKAPGMVVHLSPGHSTGTLVNALLAHCGLSACEVACGSSGPEAGGGLLSAAGSGSVLAGAHRDDDDDDDGDDWEEEGGGEEGAAACAVAAPSRASRGGEVSSSASSASSRGIIRPGIVHRLDRGTSGLMVVAKSDAAHAHLCEQFKQRSVSRIYNAITAGVPAPPSARVATNIARDPANRLRMCAAPYGSGRGRTAASNYQVLRQLAGGGAALVQWRLESGRTHQIRVHARHIGHALLGDDLYGPGHAAAARLVAGKRSSLLVSARTALEVFGRPALHARTLGFTHPTSGRRLEFDSALPPDFSMLLQQLEEWG